MIWIWEGVKDRLVRGFLGEGLIRIFVIYLFLNMGPLSVAPTKTDQPEGHGQK